MIKLVSEASEHAIVTAQTQDKVVKSAVNFFFSVERAKNDNLHLNKTFLCRVHSLGIF